MDNLINTLKSRPWLVSFTLFMAIFVGCIATIFSHIDMEYGTGEAKEVQYLGATSLEGITEMGKVWKTYPNYFIGVGIVAGFSVVGIIYSVINLSKDVE